MSILLVPRKAGIGSIMIDATLRETHSFSATKTSRPVESSARMSDHVQLQLPRVTLEGVIATQVPSPARAIALPALWRLRPYTGPLHRLAVEALRQVWEDRESVSIYTSLGEYVDMVMTSLTFNRDKTTIASLPFTAEFERDGRVNILGDVDLSGPDVGLLSDFGDLGDVALIP